MDRTELATLLCARCDSPLVRAGSRVWCPACPEVPPVRGQPAEPEKPCRGCGDKARRDSLAAVTLGEFWDKFIAEIGSVETLQIMDQRAPERKLRVEARRESDDALVAIELKLTVNGEPLDDSAPTDPDAPNHPRAGR